MRCTIKGFSLPVAMLVAGCLVAGCGSSVKSAIGSATSAAASAVSSATAGGGGGATETPTTPTETPTTTVTATETTTVPASATTSPAPVASGSAAAAGGGSGSSLLWLWILLGALILAGLITWIVRSGRRRSAAEAGWQSRLIDAYAKGSALHDAMRVAEAPGELHAGDARARWYDIQRRADDLAQTLYALRESAADPQDQARIADVLGSLQAVRSAMDAERAPGGADPQLAEVVRRRLYDFEASLRALRAGDEQYP